MRALRILLIVEAVGIVFLGIALYNLDEQRTALDTSAPEVKTAPEQAPAPTSTPGDNSAPNRAR